MTCPGGGHETEFAVLPSSGGSVEAVECEVRDLQALMGRLRGAHSLEERIEIRQRARLASGVMLYIGGVANTRHQSWKDLVSLTHQILVETSDVERLQKRGVR